MASVSSRSRMDCTWGRIRRPLGASLSMGTTSTASSPGPTRSPRMAGLSMKCSGALSSRAWRKSRMPCPLGADVNTTGSCSSCSRTGVPAWPLVSILFTTTMAGTLCSRSLSTIFSSNSPHSPGSVTTTPRSVRSNTCLVRSARSSPRAPTSSMPAVSMKSTGPRGSSSMGFSTGSVVVPANSETMDTFCRVMAFSRLDLPTFLRPKRPMCSRMPRGASSRLMISLRSVARR